jgi:hypothetical protein
MLYKYVTPARVDVLERLKIRFTEASLFNDPFDCAPAITGAIPRGPTSPTPQDRFISYHPGPTSDPFGHMSPSEFAEFNRGIILVLGTMLRGSYGILSMSATSDNSLMWAHYADSHQGMVIGFEANHPYFLKAQPIDYMDSRPRVALISDLTPGDIFFTKGSEWSYEREWRMVRPVDEADETRTVKGTPIYLFSLPPEAVLSVTLGTASSPKTERRVMKAVRSNPLLSHVRLFRTHMDRLTFAFRFEELP